MIQTRKFDTLNGRDIPLITVANDDLRVELLPYGAAIRSLFVKDRDGVERDVCLGYDDIASYRDVGIFMGAVVGRVGNRIAEATFTLNGKDYQLNPSEGRHTLHGGIEGFNRKIWDFTCNDDEKTPSVTFTYVSPDGEEGFPGTLTAKVTYTLEGSAFTIHYSATSDADTLVNLTNHAYYNLTGHANGRVDNHCITVHANHFTPVDEDCVPTGEIECVTGTQMDLTHGADLGVLLKDPYFIPTRGLDHNYVLDKSFDEAANLYCPETGIGVSVSTDAPGLQVYSGGNMPPHTGKGGVHYDLGYAMCLESQVFPDGIHHENFPSPILRKGEEYTHTFRMAFYTK